MKRILFGLTIVSLGLFTHSGEAQKKPSGSVKVRAIAKQPSADGQQVIEITMAIEGGWHVYANPAGNDIFERVKTTVVFPGANAPKVIKIDYPPGKPME